MSIAGEANLGDLGAGKAGAVTFYWNPLWNALPFLPALGFLALMALRFNRKRGAWWALVPLGAGVAGWFLLQKLNIPFVNPLFDLSYVDVAWLWLLWLWMAAMLLLAPWLTAVRWPRALLRTVYIALFTGIVCLECRSAVDNSWPTLVRLLIEGGLYLGGVALIIILVMLARLLARGKWGGWRFSARLFLVTIIVCAGLLFGLNGFLPGWFPWPVGYFTHGPLADSLKHMALSGNMAEMIALVIAGLALGGAGFGLLLPFVLVAFASPFHRERMTKLLRLEPPSLQDSSPKRHRGMAFAGGALFLCLAAAIVIGVAGLVPKLNFGTSQPPSHEEIDHADGTRELIDFRDGQPIREKIMHGDGGEEVTDWLYQNGQKSQENTTKTFPDRHREIGHCQYKDGKISRKTVTTISRDGKKEVAEQQYEYGHPTVFTTTHPDGTKDVTEYKCDVDGKTTRETQTFANGKKEIREFQYDGFRRRQETITQGDGIKSVFEYGDNGPSRETTTRPDGTKSVTTYSGGRQGQRTTTHPDGSKDLTQYQYTENGPPQITTTYADGTKTIFEWLHNEAEATRQHSETRILPNGKKEVSEYYYKNGVPIREVKAHADGSKEEYEFKDRRMLRATITQADGRTQVFFYPEPSFQ